MKISELRRSGSALVLALTFSVILAALGATTMYFIQDRYRLAHQTASWHEALLSSEGGVDLALNEMRKSLYDPDAAWTGWTTAPVNPSDPTASTVYLTSRVLFRGGEGSGSGSGTVFDPNNRNPLDRRLATWSEVTVDSPDYLTDDATGEVWYRIRSLGVCELPGAPAAAGEEADIKLRKFELFRNRRTGTSVHRPRSTRLIEAIVKPVGTFRLALLAANSIDMNNHNIVVDSYDSRYNDKSTNGFYDAAKRQKNGNIATDGTLIDAGSAQIFGSASTNGGTVLNAANVTGEIRSDFYQEILPVVMPVVIPTIGSPLVIAGSTTINASEDVYTQVVVPQISLGGQSVLRIKGAPDGRDTFAQINVSGNISLSGQASIVLDPGVHLRIFVKGNADITGNGITNPNTTLNFQLFGVAPATNPDGSPAPAGTIKVSGNGGLRGAVYAPNYDVSLVGGGNSDNIFGAFIGKSVSMTGVQSVHYDEALSDGGLISDYKVVSWFEDVR